MPSIEALRHFNSETRGSDRLRFHYEIECELGDRIRHSAKKDRKSLYRDCYDELFDRVQDHPQLIRKRNGNDPSHLESQLNLLTPWIRSTSTYLEIGAGDCLLALDMCQRVKQVHAAEISETIAANRALPDNFNLLISDGTSIDLPPNSVDLAFSNQLIEHLHPEDAIEQTENIFRSLQSGGRYICVTPNRLSGPHDISMYYDTEARGLHIKEYTYFELAAMFRNIGFSKINIILRPLNRFLRAVPQSFVMPVERVLMALADDARRKITQNKIFNRVLGIAMMAEK